MNVRAVGIIVFVLLLLVGGGIGLYLALRHKKPSQPSNYSTINMLIQGPEKDYKDTAQMAKTDLQKEKVGEFLGNVVTHFLPYKEVYIVWESLSINGHAVHWASADSLVSVLGTIPDSISVDGKFHHTCRETDKPVCTGDPCDGVGPMCTATGWICASHQICPTGPVLDNCCANSPTGPYATCMSGYVTCNPCPPNEMPTCPSDCSGNGPLCTATGWICAPGQTCPTGAALQNCCTGPNEFATCHEGKVICSVCTGPVPPCAPDCNMSGIVCDRTTGQFKCQSGVTCPPENIRNACCTGTTPMGYCDSKSGKVECKDCGPIPKQECQSCLGNAWVCTATGWACKPDQQCATDPKVLQSCCTGGLVPYCDSEHKNHIGCECPSGDPYGWICPGGICRPSICCPHGVPGNKEPLSGEWLCCNKPQVCLVGGQATCCPEGTVCVDGKDCRAICGTDSKGDPIICADGDECVILNNMSADGIRKIVQEFPDAVVVGTSVYICVSNSESCEFVGDPMALPAAIGNYYPCFSFPPLSPTGIMPGYCQFNPNQDLFPYVCPDPTGYIQSIICDTGAGTKEVCEQTTNGVCSWTDGLQYIMNSNDTLKAIAQVQNQIGYQQENPGGNFCDPTDGKTPYSRIVFYQGNQQCGPKNFITRLTQPGVTDIVYNDTNKLAAAIQSCHFSGTGPYSTVKTDDGKIVPNPHSSPPPETKFDSCSKGDCNPVISSRGLICNRDTGAIENPTIFVPQIDNCCTIVPNPTNDQFRYGWLENPCSKTYPNCTGQSCLDFKKFTDVSICACGVTGKSCDSTHDNTACCKC